MATVSDIIRDTQKNPLAGLAVTLRRLGPIVGFDGGAIVPDTKSFTTDGTGRLTMPDLATGQYEFDVSVPANPQTSQTILRRTIGVVPTDAPSEMTLEEFLTESIGNITPTLLAQAIAAADDAEAAAKSLGIASITALSSGRNLTSADAGKLLTSSLSTTVAITIPNDATAGWTDTLAVSLAQLGTGVLSVAAGSGVSLNGVANGSTEIQQRYGLCQLVRLGTDEWLVFGLTDEVTA